VDVHHPAGGSDGPPAQHPVHDGAEPAGEGHALSAARSAGQILEQPCLEMIRANPPRWRYERADLAASDESPPAELDAGESAAAGPGPDRGRAKTHVGCLQDLGRL